MKSGDIEERWDSDIQCKVCGNKCDGLLCPECTKKLQTTYGQVCLNCGNHNFLDWTAANVWDLCKKMGWDFDVIWQTNQMIIIPFKVCPKCYEERSSFNPKSENAQWN